MRQTIRLTESDIYQIVKRVINEVTLPNGSNVNGGVVTTSRGGKFDTNKRKPNFILEKNCEVLPNGAKVRNNGDDVESSNGFNFKLRKESINRIVSESVRRVLNEWDSKCRI